LPVAGRKPKPDEQKVTRHPLTQDWMDVEDVPFSGAPRLPRHPVDGQTWPRWTRRWWTVVSTMPHCILWTEADWQFAFETAAVAAEFHAGDMKVAKELRDRERKMGMTVDDRRDLRIRYVAAPEAEESGVDGDLADFESERRRRLMESG
jgi:hypothetical protein